MKLTRLLDVLGAVEIKGNKEVDFTDLAYDSRRVKPKTLFFALRGTSTDGHRFLSQCASQGAAALVVESLQEGINCPQIKVADSRLALARAAAAFYGLPSRELKIAAITGTNGKTTISYLIDAVLAAAGFTTGLIGTVAYRIKEEITPAAHTTPESLDLQKLLRHMLDRGASHVTMEVSSHGLAMNRVAETAVDVGVFSNLSLDHLDFHHSMEDYFAAKLKLFTDVLPASYPKSPAAVINVDDPYGRRICDLYEGEIISYALESPASVRPLESDISAAGIRAAIEGPWGVMEVSSRLWGRYNLLNIMAAAAAAHSLGIAPDAISRGIASLDRVPGRLERVGAGLGGPTVLVDYAHSPAALENLLGAVADIAPARIIVVFGAGGDRDRSKRPLMAKAAAKFADIAIITSDNPRSEAPLGIIADIEAGMQDKTRLQLAAARAKGAGYLVEPDRGRAIELAVDIAANEDVVVIAGKGHEDYQIIGSKKISFNDRQEALRALKQKLEN